MAHTRIRRARYTVAVADERGPLRTRRLSPDQAGRYIARVRRANPNALVTCEAIDRRRKAVTPR